MHFSRTRDRLLKRGIDIAQCVTLLRHNDSNHVLLHLSHPSYHLTWVTVFQVYAENITSHAIIALYQTFTNDLKKVVGIVPNDQDISVYFPT